MGKKITVRIPDVTVEVDEDAWMAEYGPNDDVRSDVKRYYVNDVQQSTPAEMGILKVVRYGT